MRSIIIALIMLCAPLMAQKNIPAAVTDAFGKKFPDAVSVRWEKESAKEYEASFTLNGVAVSASYSPKGEWLETETVIKSSELPTEVASAFTAAAKNGTIVGASRTETPKGTTYEVEYTAGSKKKKEMSFDPSGKTVK